MFETRSHAFRIGTFNTHLDSFLFEFKPDPLKAVKNFLSVAGLADFDSLRKAQANAIADRILFGEFDYDVIALNEVFHEDARKVLFDRLSGPYPWVLRKLPDGPMPPVPGPLLEALPGAIRSVLETLTPGANVEFEDSGLMFFSRFPIERWVFTEFDLPGASGFPDSWAAKGAVYVRVLNPRSESRIHVIATHMQEEGVELHKLELAQIHLLLTEEVPNPALADVIVLGDFNIDATLVPVGFDGRPATAASDEYDRSFLHATDDTLGTTVRDVWANHTSLRDLGWTSQGRRRIDLVLNTAKATSGEPDGKTFQRVLLPHHATLAHNLRTPAGDAISDHMGVNVEFNRDAPHCTPQRAAPAKLEDWVEGEIAHPAAIQWYRVDAPGTYAFAAIDAGAEPGAMDLRVYGATDLSRPLGQYKLDVTITQGPHEEPVVAKQFVLVDPPYYVRVRHEDPWWVGDYGFWSHRLTGRSKEEAIALVPFVPSSAEFKAGEPLNSEDVAWFKFDLEAPDSGKPQHVELRVGASTVGWTGVLLAADGTSVLAASPSAADVEIHLDDVNGRRYLKVQRNDPALKAATCEAVLGTNLTIFHGGHSDLQVGWDATALMLTCNNETDPQWGGSDSISMSVWVDGTLRLDEAQVGEFEEDTAHGVEALIPWPGFRFLDKIEVQIFEQDEGPIDPSPVVTIPGLGSKRSRSDDAVFDFEGGIYTLSYNRSHWLPIA